MDDFLRLDKEVSIPDDVKLGELCWSRGFDAFIFVSLEGTFISTDLMNWEKIQA